MEESSVQKTTDIKFV